MTVVDGWFIGGGLVVVALLVSAAVDFRATYWRRRSRRLSNCSGRRRVRPKKLHYPRPRLYDQDESDR